MAKKNKNVETKEISLSDGSTAKITMRITGRDMLNARKDKDTEDPFEVTVSLASQIVQIDGANVSKDDLLDLDLADLTAIVAVMEPLMGNGKSEKTI